MAGMLVCSGADIHPIVSSGTAKAEVLVPVAWIVRVAVRRARVPRVVVPGSTAHHALRAISSTSTLCRPWLHIL